MRFSQLAASEARFANVPGASHRRSSVPLGNSPKFLPSLGMSYTEIQVLRRYSVCG